MPIGLVSDEDFDREVDNSPVVIPEVMPMTRPGRSKGDTNVPDSLRKIIGETSEIDGRQEALKLAEQFGISPSSVSAYANGSTSTDSMDKTPNKNYINGVKERISKRARNVLRRSLTNITDGKLVAASATELAQIARSMSGIVKDMEPENEGLDVSNRPQFVVMAPSFNKEEHYNIVVQART